MAKEESNNSFKKRVEERTMVDTNESLNPLYMAKSSETSTLGRRRNNQTQDEIGTSAAGKSASSAADDLGGRSHTLGRHSKLTSSDVGSRREVDIPRSTSSGGAQLSGSMPSIVGRGSSGTRVTTESASNEVDQSERARTNTVGVAVAGELSVQSDSAKAAPQSQGPAKLTRIPSTVVPVTNLPRINCQEKIIICLDISKEMDKKYFVFRQGNKSSPIDLSKKALNIFLNTKHMLGSEHEFALMLLDSKAHWMCDFTSDPSRIITCLDGVKNFVETDECDLSSIFQEISNHVQLPEGTSADSAPLHTVRIILIYGRSFCQPSLTSSMTRQTFQTSDYFFFDVLYVHEAPTSDNSCEAIFEMLCTLDFRGNSYVLAATKNPTKVFDCVAQLLGHPLQRPLQQNANFALTGNGSGS